MVTFYIHTPFCRTGTTHLYTDCGAFRVIFRPFLGTVADLSPGSLRNNGVKCLERRWGLSAQCLLFTDGVPAPGGGLAVQPRTSLCPLLLIFKDKNNLKTLQVKEHSVKYLQKTSGNKTWFFRFRKGDVTIGWMKIEETFQDIIYKKGLT